MSILTPHGRWMVHVFFSVGVATQHFDQLEKQLQSELEVKLEFSFRMDKKWIQVPSTRKYSAGEMEEPRIHGQDGRSRSSPSACFTLCFWYFVLESFFQSGLESPRQFLLWAGEPKVYFMLFDLRWGGSPKSTLGFCYRKRSHDGGDIEATYNYNIL